ncbi:hypothetical protein, partial [Frankia sp. CpI1-P]|uniref:hypothetical protein n=1 Tax=Frankia sp. CpI1-P TaxID=1502734 RepID=UPI0006F2FF58
MDTVAGPAVTTESDPRDGADPRTVPTDDMWTSRLADIPVFRTSDSAAPTGPCDLVFGSWGLGGVDAEEVEQVLLEWSGSGDVGGLAG